MQHVEFHFFMDVVLCRTLESLHCTADIGRIHVLDIVFRNSIQLVQDRLILAAVSPDQGVFVLAEAVLEPFHGIQQPVVHRLQLLSSTVLILCLGLIVLVCILHALVQFPGVLNILSLPGNSRFIIAYPELPVFEVILLQRCFCFLQFLLLLRPPFTVRADLLSSCLQILSAVSQLLLHGGAAFAEVCLNLFKSRFSAQFLILVDILVEVIVKEWLNGLLFPVFRRFGHFFGLLFHFYTGCDGVPALFILVNALQFGFHMRLRGPRDLADIPSYAICSCQPAGFLVL